MKREYPRFIIDASRRHKLGACDFLVATDQENGFVAKIDYTTKKEESTDTKRLIENKGIFARIEVKKIFGKNPNMANIRTLLKKGFEEYASRVQKRINKDAPTVKQCIDFVDVLINNNESNLADIGSDYTQQQILLTSLSMLENVGDYLRALDAMKEFYFAKSLHDGEILYAGTEKMRAILAAREYLISNEFFGYGVEIATKREVIYSGSSLEELEKL